MAKYNFYAIARGIDPDTNEEVNNMIFNEWAEAKKYVINVDGAVYKGFLSDSEANLWLASQVADLASGESKKLAKKNKNDYRFDEICKELNISKDSLTKHLQNKFVEEYDYLHRR